MAVPVSLYPMSRPYSTGLTAVQIGISFDNFITSYPVSGNVKAYLFLLSFPYIVNNCKMFHIKVI